MAQVCFTLKLKRNASHEELVLKRPTLITQANSIRSKCFVIYEHSSVYILCLHCLFDSQLYFIVLPTFSH